MFTKHTHSILAVFAALIGANAVSAGNDQPWHYDKDSDTIVYSFVWYPSVPEAPNVSQQNAENLPWYYDEQRDTVVFNFVGKPVAPVAAAATQQTAVYLPWHYDEEIDTVLYNFAERPGDQTIAIADMPE